MSSPTPTTTHPASALLTAYLRTIASDIIPLTRAGVAAGSKVFGAAVLRKDDLSTVMVATNDEAKCPLWHGEMNCIKKFYEELPAATRPKAKDCLFLTTHEPCSLCISGITWGGFDNFTYLFTYTDTLTAFSIPHDINILSSVYRVRAEGESDAQLQARELYNRKNSFFTSTSLSALLGQLDDTTQRDGFERQIAEIKELYMGLAGVYKENKGGVGIPLD